MAGTALGGTNMDWGRGDADGLENAALPLKAPRGVPGPAAAAVTMPLSCRGGTLGDLAVAASAPPPAAVLPAADGWLPPPSASTALPVKLPSMSTLSGPLFPDGLSVTIWHWRGHP